MLKFVKDARQGTISFKNSRLNHLAPFLSFSMIINLLLFTEIPAIGYRNLLSFIIYLSISADLSIEPS